MDAYEKRRFLERLLARPDSPVHAELIFPMLGDEDAIVRNLATRLLTRAGHPALFSYLERSLGSPDKNERSLYVQCLRQIKNTTAAMPLLDLLADPDPEVRLSTALAFASFGDLSMSLATRRWQEFSREDRVAVVRTFGRFVFGAGELFLAALEDDDWWVRVEAVKALAGSRAPFAKALLTKAIGDVSPQVSSEAARSLRTA